MKNKELDEVYKLVKDTKLVESFKPIAALHSSMYVAYLDHFPDDKALYLSTQMAIEFMRASLKPPEE